MNRKSLFLALAIALGASGAVAQTADDIDRLRAAIAHRPDDNTVDTALVFTNVSRAAAKVKVQAFGRNGAALGTAELEVPANALRYVMASELATNDERTLLGHAEAITVDRRVIATAVLVGAGTTDLPVVVRPVPSPVSTATDPAEVAPRRLLKHIFPVIASY